MDKGNKVIPASFNNKSRVKKTVKALSLQVLKIVQILPQADRTHLWNPRKDTQIRKSFSYLLKTLPSLIEPLLAELVVDIFPSIEMVRFLKTGAEACSAAIRLARAFTNRNYILSSGYFGWHDWSQKGKGISAATQDLHSEFVFNDPIDFLNKLDRLPEGPAAVVMEPVVQEQPEIEFLSVIGESCDKFDIVLIWDEVKTGARMAPGGSQQYYSFKSDLTILGKGIANGMPLAAVGGKREIMEAWGKTWISSTFVGGKP